MKIQKRVNVAQVPALRKYFLSNWPSRRHVLAAKTSQETQGPSLIQAKTFLMPRVLQWKNVWRDHSGAEKSTGSGPIRWVWKSIMIFYSF